MGANLTVLLFDEYLTGLRRRYWNEYEAHVLSIISSIEFSIIKKSHKRNLLKNTMHHLDDL